jgi:hemoglobin
MMTDITSRKDIQVLVDAFYDKVNRDPLLGPLFSHVNWPTHLPIMYDFWSSMVLGDQSYRGNPFGKHVPLPIKANHFDVWLSLFKQTVDENFRGSTADEIKMRAQSIAGVWRHKMNLNT